MRNETHTIAILGFEEKGDKIILILSDNGLTNAHINDEIIWVVGHGSGVDRIVKIEKKGENVFKDPPSEKLKSDKNKESTIWEGKCKDYVDRKDHKENYEIKFIDDLGKEHTSTDPTIQLNP